MELTTLSATELLSTLDTAWTAGNRALAKMLAYLGEVERRGLHEKMSCSSMFAFLERRFGLTGGSAYRRLTAARLVRRFPTIVRREVFERDGEQCTHVDAQDNRCGSRAFLELDHATPRARGGTDDASNLRVVCRTHNRMYAEQVFGKDYVAARMTARRAPSATRAPPALSITELTKRI